MRVMVIVSDQRYESDFDPFPPVGTKGTVIGDIDSDGDYEVEFDNWPPTTLLDPLWFAHKSMIVFIDNDKCKQEKLNKEEVLTV